MITEYDLQVCINAYREGKLSNDQILQVFGKLVNMVLIHKNWQFGDSDIAEAANLCLLKLPRYNNNKGKAVFFFTTIIGCYLGQTRHIAMNLQRLGKQHDY